MSGCVSTSTEVGGGVHWYCRGIHSQHRMEMQEDVRTWMGFLDICS